MRADTIMEPRPISPQGSPDDPQHDAAELLARIKSGDRDAAAAFALRYGPLIRRRIGHRLGPRMRRLFDSQDILSTVLRRFDLYVRSGRLMASTEAQLWTLIIRIAEAAVVDKVRLLERLKAAEAADQPWVKAMLEQAEHGNDEAIGITLEQAMNALSDETDRKILWLWLAGVDHRLTGELLELSHDAVRKRWQRIREELRRVFTGGSEA